MDCPHCQLGNLPIDRTCRHCHKEVQTAEQAAAKKAEWDALPPAVRAEYEKNFKTLDDLHQDHLNWWRSNRRVTMAIAGTITVTGMVMIAPCWIGIPMDFIVGALATRLLFNIKGGAYKGLGLFILVYVVCVVLNNGAIGFGGGSMGGAAMGFLFFCVGFLLLVTTGYFLGWKLDDEHGARATVA